MALETKGKEDNAIKQCWSYKSILTFESPEMILPCWDTWGRSNQPASVNTFFFFFILTKVVCLIYLECFVENPGEFSLPPLVSLATLGRQKRIWHQVNLCLTNPQGCIVPNHSFMVRLRSASLLKLTCKGFPRNSRWEYLINHTVPKIPFLFYCYFSGLPRM